MESSDYREVRARERDPKEDWGDGFACAKPEPPGPTVYRFVRSDSKSVSSTTHALLHVRRGCVGNLMFPVDSPVSHGSFALANDSGDPRVLWAHQSALTVPGSRSACRRRGAGHQPSARMLRTARGAVSLTEGRNALAGTPSTSSRRALLM